MILKVCIGYRPADGHDYAVYVVWNGVEVYQENMPLPQCYEVAHAIWRLHGEPCYLGNWCGEDEHRRQWRSVLRQLRQRMTT